ncbi:hypothetical protein Hanom_Chr09g00858231 [Helianthus anomalus]
MSGLRRCRKLRHCHIHHKITFTVHIEALIEPSPALRSKFTVLYGVAVLDQRGLRLRCRCSETDWFPLLFHDSLSLFISSPVSHSLCVT